MNIVKWDPFHQLEGNTEARIKDCLSIVRGEFSELPGLQLTKPQIQVLCGIQLATCEALLNELLRQNFLVRSPRGSYGRVNTH